MQKGLPNKLGGVETKNRKSSISKV